MTDKRTGLAIVVLAAGASRRLGTAKQNVVLAGKTLVRRSLELATAATTSLNCPARVHLVTGACVPGPQDLAGLDVRIHHNPDWASGQASSVGVAARAAMDAAGMLILLCDQYRLRPGDLLPLTQSFEAQPDRIVAAGYAETRGAPVIWPATAIARLARGESTGKALLAAPDVVICPVANAAFDLDDKNHLVELRHFERVLESDG